MLYDAFICFPAVPLGWSWNVMNHEVDNICKYIIAFHPNNPRNTTQHQPSQDQNWGSQRRSWPKVTVSGNLVYRFTWVCSMSNDSLLCGDPCPFISVTLFVFKVRKPQSSLVFCTLVHLLLLQIIHLFGSLHQSYLNKVSRPGWTTPSRCFKTWRKNWSVQLQGWIGFLAARGPFWQFLVVATVSIWWSMISSGKIRECLCRDRFWQQVLWLGAPLGLLGAPGFLSDEC